MSTFKAIFAQQIEGKPNVSLQQIDRASLPPGDVLVRVRYSDLNYKDGLAVTGRPGVIRKYPMIPGVDLAGVVEESSSADWKPGDEVVITGCGLSETAWGGYAELARVDASWLVGLPQGLTLKQSMAIGTAGFTAMQCVVALERHGLAAGSGGEVLVTGAAGGVGSIAVAILAKLGYRVTASTGRAELGDYLRSLGASEIVDRASLTAPSKRPMDSERWAGAVDTVGGDTLAAIVRALVANGSVAACGVAGGAALNTTVYPFILRGVNLLGINSVYVSRSDRLLMWERLARDLPLSLLDSLTQEAPLEAVFDLGEKILAGGVRGRTVIRIA
ncbi:MAG TPA: MDR family oxidoreductase [Candidatus Sulfopaludibacter sp.]|nr:MDR family oxidoreductase [Candidatus Sulfopaludibacter sp.]